MLWLRNLKEKKGFTLVELIVVVAIIAILSAILVPAMSNVMETARVSGAMSSANVAKNSMNTFMTETTYSSGGRRANAPLVYYEINITRTSASVNVHGDGDAKMWTEFSTDAELEAALIYVFRSLGNGSIVLAVQGAHPISCVYTREENVAADLVRLFNGADVPTVGVAPPLTDNFIDEETKYATISGSPLNARIVGHA